MAIDLLWVLLEPGSPGGLKTRDKLDALPEAVLISVLESNDQTPQHQLAFNGALCLSDAQLRNVTLEAACAGSHD